MEPGIYEGWPAQVYHEADGINASFLRAIVKNTLFHVKGGHQGSAIARKMADTGTAFHAMELEPENNLVHFFSTTLRKGEAWANAYAESEAQGHTLLPKPGFEMVQNMVAAIGKNQQYNKLRNAPNGKRELSVFAQHKPTGQLIKCRVDLFVPDYGS